MLLFKNRICFPWVFVGFLKRRIPGKNGEGTPRKMDTSVDTVAVACSKCGLLLLDVLYLVDAIFEHDGRHRYLSLAKRDLRSPKTTNKQNRKSSKRKHKNSPQRLSTTYTKQISSNQLKHKMNNKQHLFSPSRGPSFARTKQ